VKLQGKTGRVLAGDVEISFQRSRDGRSLGYAPFDSTRAFAAAVPASWQKKNAIFLHLLPGETLWIGVSGSGKVEADFEGETLATKPPHPWIEGSPAHPFRAGELILRIGAREELKVYLVTPELYRSITGRAPRSPTPESDTYGGYLLP
jgi:hypothetical protein